MTVQCDNIFGRNFLSAKDISHLHMAYDGYQGIITYIVAYTYPSYILSFYYTQ